MTHQRLLSLKRLILIPIAITLLAAVACGEADTPAPVVVRETVEVTKEVPVVVTKEVVVTQEVQVTKEVVITQEVQVTKEVVVTQEVQVTVIAQPTPTDPPSLPGISGGSYPIINSGFPARWDPHLAATLPEIGAISPLYNQVVEFNPVKPDEIIGDLASGWEANDDFTSYVFTIRDGIKWSDGEDLTAEDVAFSINRMIEEGEPRPRAGLLRTSTKNAEAIDSSKVRVNLNFPDASFLPFLAVDFMKVVPKHLFDAGTDINVWDNIVGSGPYLPEEIAQGSFSRHTRNPDYFKAGLPYFDEMTVFVFSDPGTAAAAFETDQLLGSTAGITIDTEGVFELASKLEGKYTLYSTPLNSGTHIISNWTREPWNDWRVLAGLRLAVDQQEILDAFDAGGTHNYGAPFPVGSWYGSSVPELRRLPGYGGITGSSRTKDQDIADAKALLAQAGYDPPSELGTITLTVTNIIWFPDVAQLFQEQMRRNLGVDIELNTVDFSTGFGALQNADFDLGVFGYAYNISDPNDYVRAIYGPTARNYSDWRDDNFLNLFEQQAREPDRERRRLILREMETMLLERSPLIEAFWVNNRYFISDRIKTAAGSFVPPESIQTVLKQEHLWLEP